ncbi:MAG: hypothetical protein HQ546_08765 [Planctomycetes bacterium]|nr:hypothetical protein [Planctomycetota bacterium]
MADETQELQRVNWTELFSFTQIFKGFRMAIHPSKLLLALAAVVLTCFLGLGLDWIWSWGGAGAQVGDIYAYYQAPSSAVYGQMLDQRSEKARWELASWRVQAVEGARTNEPVLSAYREAGGAMTSALGKQVKDALDAKNKSSAPPSLQIANVLKDVEDDMDDVWEKYAEATTDMLDDAEKVFFGEAEDSARKTVKAMTAKEEKQAREQLEKDLNAARRALWHVRLDGIEKRKEQLYGRGLSCVLMNYERQCVRNAVSAVCRGDFASGFSRVFADHNTIKAAAIPVGMALPYGGTTSNPDGVGFLPSVFLMLWGPVWLICNHLIYAIIFLLVTLAIWALFGGAIARIAALHAAREEKITITQALRFSIGKFFSFFTAPLIPLAIILVLAVLMGLGGLLGTFAIGDVIMGVLFVLALVLGAIVTFLCIGLAAGLPLMYPTIAVEGSDSFDAISRSFSYVFTRPWRYALYSVIAVVYGTISYLFVRLFAFLTLLSAHFFVAKGLLGTGLGLNKAPELADGATKMDLLWPRPTFDQLAGNLNFSVMGGIESAASFIINIWVYLVAGLVVAFVLSFWVSSYTTIYYLLRRKVDATDLDDVYIDELDAEEQLPEVPAEPAETAKEPTGQQEPAEPTEQEGPADEKQVEPGDK